MHRSSVHLRFDEQAPETLVAFLDGRALPSITRSDTNTEPPKKRRKVTVGNAAKVLPPPAVPYDYLTLARIDLSIAFQKSPSESYPSPSSDKSGPRREERIEQHPVLLESFTRNIEGQYQCRITTILGEVLLDDVVHSNITPQAFEVLQLAIDHPIRRPQKDMLRSKFAISKSLGFDHDAQTLGFAHDPYLPTMHLSVQIFVPNARDMAGSIGVSRNDIFDICLPETLSDGAANWAPRDFYDSVHVPEKDVLLQEYTGIEKLQCQLYPFQKRALQWLLWREGAENAHGLHGDGVGLPHGFFSTTDSDGRTCFASKFLGIFTTDEHLPARMGSNPKGGILAEEMGLGKTVEMIALMCVHKYESSNTRIQLGNLPQSSATLIITPPAILQQWKTELETLAPSLNVLIYGGVKVEADKRDHDDLRMRCMQHDVVLTTYNVLAKEIHYAETPDRGLRHEKRYEKRLSPLTQIVWWRVILDEAQMVENGVSNAAKVAKLIPREIAWCVSGTPVKKDSRDLFGLLDFLGYEPYCNLPIRSWDRLVTHHKDIFRQIFGTLALRHTKDQIKDDLQLPEQTRVVITVPFTQIEEQHYATMFRQMSDDCGLDLNGAPTSDEWDPESPVVIEKMRNWLARLRQTCLHPEVGARNRRALGNGKGPLRTVNEVLEVMIEQNDTAARTEERTFLLSKIRRGQILEHARLSNEALNIWSETLQEAQMIVKDCRDRLQSEIDRLGLTEELIMTGESDDPDAATITRTGPHRQRLRAALEIEHMCTFFVANAYYQIRQDETLVKPGSDRYCELERIEDSTYEKARLLRKELLREAHNKAEALMVRLSDSFKHRSLVKIPEISPLKERGGIESRMHCEKVDKLITVMRTQATQLEEWREKTLELLLLPLVDEQEKDLQGDEYETSTRQQDEVYVYVDALRALIADRHDIVTGQENELIKHEMLVALKQAKDGQGHSPELLKQLLSIQNKLKPSKDLGSVRGMITELREVKTSLRGSVERGNSRAAAEMIFVNTALTKLHQISTEQTKAVTGLDREIELFKDTMNLRLEYYRQLQAISDMVAPYEEDLTEEARTVTLLDKVAAEYHMRARIDGLKSRGRYLLHLRKEATNTEDQRMCVICQSPFEVGVLTTCGHSYCVECLRFWWGTHRNCPTCKKHLSRNDFHQITYKPQELTMEEEMQPKEKEPGVTKDSTGSAIYSGIRDTILNEIKNIDLDGSFGTKIDTLARHILWIREHDPGAKSIVFSQYRDFLDVLARAFGQFKIGFTGIDRKDDIQRFKNDPSKECFFLHARAHSSGLNLVNATHVFLCEPLINTAIELQAIARVHRIGQHQPTTVWMYLVDGTVEKSIYDISVARRQALMGRAGVDDVTADDTNLESKIEAANTLELEQAPLANLLAKGSSSGEMVAQEDLWNCLFQQRRGQKALVSEEAERVIARHVGADAAEARIGQGAGPGNSSSR